MKLKNWTDRTVLNKFLPISKKVSELFRSPNIVLATKSSSLVQLCSFLVGRLHISQHWWPNKQNGLNEPFWTSFYLYPKSIRARWGLTFSIIEHCFGHQIVNFSTIVLIFDGYALLQPLLAMSLKNWTERTVLDKFLPISKK